MFIYLALDYLCPWMVDLFRIQILNDSFSLVKADRISYLLNIVIMNYLKKGNIARAFEKN